VPSWLEQALRLVVSISMTKYETAIFFVSIALTPLLQVCDETTVELPFWLTIVMK